MLPFLVGDGPLSSGEHAALFVARRRGLCCTDLDALADLGSAKVATLMVYTDSSYSIPRHSVLGPTPREGAPTALPLASFNRVIEQG
jgi:hypothetical protein